MRTPKEHGRSDRNVLVSNAIRAIKEITELPKNPEWRIDETYTHNLIARVLEICERYGMVPGPNHLAAALGITKDMEHDVRAGVIPATEGVAAELNKYYAICEATTSEASLNGGANNITGIFLLKSQYGYTEAPREVVITHNELLGERKDPAAIAARYREAMVIDGDYEEVPAEE